MKVNWRQLDVRIYAAATSLALSMMAVLVNQVPNRDAFTYMRTAEILLAEGLQAAMAHYTWIAYPALIALVQIVPGVDMFHAAQIVNAALYVLVTVVFITLVRELDASPRILILAAIVILAYPHINEYRAHLIRDIGFLGFCLLALLNLVRFHRHVAPRHAIGFCAALLAAFLFRAEAMVFLALAPLALLVDASVPLGQRCRRLAIVYGLALAALVAGFLLALVMGLNVVDQLSTYLRIYLPFVDQASASLFGDTTAISQALFTEHAANLSSSDIPLILTGGLITLLGAMIMESFGLIFLGALLYGWTQKMTALPAAPRTDLWAFALTALLVLLAFTLIARFMTTRYTMVFCVVLVLLVPLIIDRAWTRAQARGTLRRFGWVVGYFALYSMIDAHITFGESKDFTVDAIDWINTNEQQAPIITNKSYVAWRSGRVPDYDKVEDQVSLEDMLGAAAGTLLVVERDGDLIEQLDADGTGLERLQSFEDRRGDRIVIYRAR